MTVMRGDVSFTTRDGSVLSGWLYQPASRTDPGPCIVMTHGFTAIIDQGLAPFAQRFADAGFAVLVYDHRGFGRSGGGPRQETNPFLQMQDMRDAITWASMQPSIDASRIGVWGTSYSGGHALMVAAVDRRVRCVVSVVPLISGSETIKRLTGQANLDARFARLCEARKAEMSGGGTQYQVHATVAESVDWFTRSDAEQRWQNKISVLSTDMLMEYEPGDYVHRIAPTPLLMVLTDHDNRCCTDLQLDAFERARQPKELLMLPGGHYTAYEEHLEAVAAASSGWFNSHLGRRDP